ncbi:MAG: AraC family transcriptional regulator [Bacteroidota bacterium]
MKSKIKTYDSESFRNEYFNSTPELDRLFSKSIEDFFCLRIEDISERVLKPIHPSREESHTIIFLLSGSYQTKIGFKEYTVTPNQLVVFQAGAVFSTEQIATNVKGYACHFHPDILIGEFGNRWLISDFEFLYVGNEPTVAVKQESRPALQHVFERLWSEFKSDGNPNPMIVHAYLYALLAEMKVVFAESNRGSQRASFQITSQFRKLAHEHVKKNLKVADFAEMMNISPNHLNKSVKRITSKSASDIHDEIKLIEIKFLLYQSGLSVSEISHEMGYLDASYFTRFFKKRTRLSPTEFRNRIEKS